jgi:hypothetical protein
MERVHPIARRHAKFCLYTLLIHPYYTSFIIAVTLHEIGSCLLFDTDKMV